MAEDQDKAQQTEEPTAKRLEQARENGDVVKSTEVTTFILLGGGTLAIAMFGKYTAVGLARGTTRREALVRLVPALRRAAFATGLLTADELSRWSARDVARGRAVEAPRAGTVAGISSRGELLVRATDGTETAHRSGTLTFAEPLACS